MSSDLSGSNLAGGGGPVPSSGVEIPVIGAPSVDTLTEYLDRFGSAGTVPGTAFITDAGSQLFDVAGGAGFIRVSNSHTAALKSFEWSALAGNAIPDGTARYVGVHYNAGAPAVIVKTSDTWNDHDEFRLGSVVREGTTLHILNNPQTVIDGLGHIIHRFYETLPFKRADRIGGLILGETGTRNLTVSAGELYDGLNEFAISAINTSGADTFDAYYGSFTKIASQTQWDNLQYDNAGTLTALGVSKWGVHWLYLEADGSLVLIYGQGQYNTRAGAELSTAPASIPLRLQTHGLLIGRLIFQQNAATATDVESVFAGTLTPTGATIHNDLSGIQGGAAGEYYHLTAAQHTATVKKEADIHLSYNDKILTKLMSWAVVSDFVFRGTTARGTPSAIKAIAHVGDVAESGQIRIYDYTNSQVICTVTGITSLTKTLYNLGTLSNLPAGEAIFEIQMQTTAGKEFYLRSLIVEY
jgi:hypothetical protein